MNNFADKLVGKVTSGQKWRKKKCDKCGKVLNRLIKDKEGFLVCGHCKNKNKTILGGNYGTKISEEEALSRTYTFNSYPNKKGGRFISVGFPVILAEKKFKIVLVDEEEENKNE